MLDERDIEVKGIAITVSYKTIAMGQNNFNLRFRILSECLAQKQT